MKTQLTDVTLVDLLMVAQALPQDEIEQLEAFTGNPFDPEQLATQIYTSGGIKWACRVIETAEPMVVAGYFKVGVSTWRSFMLATDRAWTEHGREITDHVKGVIQKLADSDEFIRLETICLEGRERAMEWYGKIGLTREGVMRSYGVKGENAVMYVKINQPSLIQLV